MRKRRRILYLFVYYLVFIIVFSIIKHFADWDVHTFEKEAGDQSNFIASTLALLSEIVLVLVLGVILFLITPTKAIGNFIIWTTATVIPVAIFFVISSYIVFGFINDRLAGEANQQLHAEIINRLPTNTFKKQSGSRTDFTGYVTANNDSLGLITPDTGHMARIYIYVDSAKLGAFNFDSCMVCNAALQKILTSIVIPLQSFSPEEVLRNIKLVNDGQCYVAGHNIYLGQCSKRGRQFIIINNVYDKIRRIPCYEIGFEADVKTPAAHRLDLFE